MFFFAKGKVKNAKVKSANIDGVILPHLICDLQFNI